ncbi:MAG: alpha/beta hydrolase [Sporichthyaceae bacterium]
MTTSPALLQTVEYSSGPDPLATVIVLHGLGDSGDGWAPLAPHLIRPGWPAVRMIFPHAPIRPVTINGGMAMRAWYDIVDLDDIDRRADAAGVLESADAVEALIAREVERGIPAGRIILAGFSQGGVISLAIGLRRREPLGGLIALSTYLPMAGALTREAAGHDQRPPVFMAHGLHDPMLPHRAGEMAAEHMRQAGFDVEWHSYPMGHEACPAELADLAAWLGPRILAA